MCAQCLPMENICGLAHIIKVFFRYDLSTGVMKEIKTSDNKELKIVRNIVKDHKGNIWVASSFGS